MKRHATANTGRAHVTIDTTTPAVVLKLDRNAMHHAALGAIRSLGRLGVPVYGVHAEPWAPAARSRYLSGRWFWRAPTHDAQRLLDGLVALAERIGRRCVLIPTDDVAAIFLAEHAAPLRQCFQFPGAPTQLPRRVAGKYSLYQLCQQLGVPCPVTALPGSVTEALQFADRVGFPLIAKPATPGARGTSILHTRDDLVRSYRGPEAADQILQEYIPRCPSQDYFFHGYCDARSRCVPGYVGIKERSYPAHAGPASLVRWVDNPELHKQAGDLLTRLGYQGIVALDYRWDPRDGQYKLLGFNPRLGAQFRLFRDDAGVDVVVAAYQDLTGHPISAGVQLTGRRLLVENRDPMAALAYRRSGELNLLWWMMSLRLVDEMAWFARDDLTPFGLMCLRMGWRAMVPARTGSRSHRQNPGRRERSHRLSQDHADCGRR